MNCTTTSKLLHAYQSGELPPDEARRVCEHLESCDHCREFADWFEGEVDEIRRDGVGRACLDEGFAGEVIARLLNEDPDALRRARRRRLLTVAAGTLATAAAVLFVVLLSTGSPSHREGLHAGQMLVHAGLGAWQLEHRYLAPVATDVDIVIPGATTTEIGLKRGTMLRSDGAAKFVIRDDDRIEPLAGRMKVETAGSGQAELIVPGGVVKLGSGASTAIFVPDALGVAEGESLLLEPASGTVELVLDDGAVHRIETGERATLRVVGRGDELESYVRVDADHVGLEFGATETADIVAAAPRSAAIPRLARRTGDLLVLGSLVDPEASVRLSAIETLRLMDVPGAAVQLRGIVHDERENVEVRTSALAALAALSLADPDSEELLAPMLSSLSSRREDWATPLALRAVELATVALSPQTVESWISSAREDETGPVEIDLRADAADDGQLSFVSDVFGRERSLIRYRLEAEKAAMDREATLAVVDELLRLESEATRRLPWVYWELYRDDAVEDLVRLFMDPSWKRDDRLRGTTAIALLNAKLDKDTERLIYDESIAAIQGLVAKPRLDGGLLEYLNAMRIIRDRHADDPSFVAEAENDLLIEIVDDARRFSSNERIQALRALVYRPGRASELERTTLIRTIESEEDLRLRIVALAMLGLMQGTDPADLASPIAGVAAMLRRIDAGGVDGEPCEWRILVLEATTSLLRRGTGADAADLATIAAAGVQVFVDESLDKEQRKVGLAVIHGVPDADLRLASLAEVFAEVKGAFARSCVKMLVPSLTDDAMAERMLVPRLDSEDSGPAADGLCRYARAQDDAWERLARLVRHDHEAVRRYAVRYWAALAAPDPAQREERDAEILRLTRDLDPSVQVAALIVAGRMKLMLPEQASEEAIAILADSSIDSFEALQVVDYLDSTSTNARLTEQAGLAFGRLIRDHGDDLTVLQSVMHLLSGLGGAVVPDEVRGLASAADGNWWCRAVAKVLIAGLGDAADAESAVEHLLAGPASVHVRLDADAVDMDELRRPAADRTLWLIVLEALDTPSYSTWDEDDKDRSILPTLGQYREFLVRWADYRRSLSNYLMSPGDDLRREIASRCLELETDFALRVAIRLLADSDDATRAAAESWIQGRPNMVKQMIALQSDRTKPADEKRERWMDFLRANPAATILRKIQQRLQD